MGVQGIAYFSNIQQHVLGSIIDPSSENVVITIRATGAYKNSAISIVEGTSQLKSVARGLHKINSGSYTVDPSTDCEIELAGAETGVTLPQKDKLYEGQIFRIWKVADGNCYIHVPASCILQHGSTQEDKSNQTISIAYNEYRRFDIIWDGSGYLINRSY